MSYITHKMTGTPEYQAWSNIRQRCYTPQNPGYKNYGGRGIRMCKRWRNSFQNFYNDMGKRPPGRFTIDRIDNDGNYSPENVRWASYGQQLANTRKNVRLTYQGKTLHLCGWSRIIGIDHKTIKARFNAGLPMDQVMSPYKQEQKMRKLTPDDVRFIRKNVLNRKVSATALAKKYGVTKRVIYCVEKGVSYKNVL